MVSTFDKVQLNEIAQITRLAGYEYSAYWKEDVTGPIIALRGFNIGKNCLSLKNISTISDDLSLKLKRSRLCKNDVVYPCVGTIGNATVITEDNKYHIQQNIARIIPNSNQVDSHYLAHYLMSEYGLNEIQRFNGTSSQPNILVGSLRQYYILLPSLSEQSAIAAALSDTDKYIATLEKLIDKKRAIKQGAMQELLTGKRRLDGFSGEWNYTDISSEFDLFAGGDLDKENFSSSKTNVYRYSIFANALQNDGLYGYTSVPKYKGDSITITGRGDVGTAMYRRYPFDAIVRLLVLSPKTNNTVDSRFVTYLINTCIKFPSESTGVPQLTVPQIKNVELFLPPKPEQTAIAQVIYDMDKEIDALNTKLDKLSNIKQGMMSELLTGRIRLIEEV